MHSSAVYTCLMAALASTALASGTEIVTETRTSITTKTLVATAVASAGTGSVSTSNTPLTTPVTQLNIYNVYSLAPTVTPIVSIISANPTATCFAVACPLSILDTNSEDCGNLKTPLTITEGASVIQYGSSATSIGSASAVATQSVSVSCALDGTTAAVCAAQTIGGNNNTVATGSSTYTMQGTAMWHQIPAQITAGSYKLLNNTNGLAGSGSSAGTIGTLSTSTTVGRTPPKPTTQSANPSSTPAPSSSSSSQMAAGIAVPAVGSIAGLLLAFAAVL